MKKYLLLFAALAFLASPALALDPHYAGTVTVQNQSTVSATAATTWTVTSLTPATVNTGTNSFFITADVTFDAPLGSAVHIQLSKTVSAVTTIFTDTVQDISGSGRVTISYALDSVAASTALNLAVVIDQAGMPVKIKRATITAVGLAGATQ